MRLKLYDKNILVLINILIAGTIGYAQQVDSLRLAITDELKRNFTELKSDELESPFYISYTVKDYETLVVNASLGGILSSDLNHVRSSNTRVLVGSYDFNDESLQENSVEPYYSVSDMEVPLENDYNGIRRSLWLSTDKVYKTAGEIYNRLKADLKEKEKEIEDIPHLKFYKAKSVVITDVKNQQTWDIKLLENKIVALSELFLKFPKLSASSVSLTIQKEMSYFANSEGTDVKIGDQLVSLYIRAALQDESGTYIFDQRRFSANDIQALFNGNDINKSIEELCLSLDKKQTAAKLDDSYEGPVLFMDESVTDVIATILPEFSPNPPKSDENHFGGEYEQANSLENKIGKRTMSDKLSITLRPTLSMYENQPVLGAFQIDDEGIVPNEEVVLVENGVVKNLMTSRNYKKPAFIPNGTGQNPGVIEVEIKSKLKTSEALKKRLVEMAIEEGLEFGVIVKSSNNFRMLDIYKIYPDGKEVLFTNAAVQDFDIKTLRKVVGGTKSKNLYNMTYAGGITSYIVPSAVLLEEVEIEPIRMSPFKLDLPLVESPIKAISEEN